MTIPVAAAAAQLIRPRPLLRCLTATPRSAIKSPLLLSAAGQLEEHNRNGWPRILRGNKGPAIKREIIFINSAEMTELKLFIRVAENII